LLFLGQLANQYGNARWLIKGSKNADFRLVYFKRKKTSKLPLEFFLRPWWRYQKSLGIPQLWRHTQKVQTKNSLILKNQN